MVIRKVYKYFRREKYFRRRVGKKVRDFSFKCTFSLPSIRNNNVLSMLVILVLILS